MLIREKLVIETDIGFSVNSGNNFVNFEEQSSRRTIVILERTQWSFQNYNPKQLFAKLKQKSWNCFEDDRKINGEKQDGCSSEKERKVNALALRADEGRDNLR